MVTGHFHARFLCFLTQVGIIAAFMADAFKLGG